MTVRLCRDPRPWGHPLWTDAVAVPDVLAVDVPAAGASGSGAAETTAWPRVNADDRTAQTFAGGSTSGSAAPPAQQSG